MAYASPTSSACSSAVPFGEPDPSTVDLQPPPLRLPRREIVVSFDGANSISSRDMSSAEDPFTSSSHQDSLDPPPKPAICKASSQHRTAAPKLESLVSKFEILDTVNNVEVSSSPKPRLSAIPTDQGPVKRHIQRRPSESCRQTASKDKHGTAANFSDVSPRQVPSPPPTINKSKFLVSTLSKGATQETDVKAESRLRVAESEATTREKEKSLGNRISPIRGDPSLIANRRRMFEHEPNAASDRLETSRLAVPQSASSSPQKFPKSNYFRQNSPPKPKLPTTSSASPLSASTTSREQQPAGKPGLRVKPIGLAKGQRLSVADLRRSFEQASQSPEQAAHTTSQFEPVSARNLVQTTQSSKELLHLYKPSYQGTASPAKDIRQRDVKASQISQNVGVKTTYTGQRGKTSEQSVHAPYASKGSQLYQKRPYTFDGNASIGHEGIIDEGEWLRDTSVAEMSDGSTTRGTKASSRLSLIRSFLPHASKMGSPVSLASRCRAITKNRTEGQVYNTSESKPKTATSCKGKVSDLRRFFERSSAQSLSPHSFKTLWKSRSRRYDYFEPSTEMTEHISGRIPVPELTTEILTNDFSCDFGEASDNAGPTRLKVHLNTEPDRIQQFERLEHSQPYGIGHRTSIRDKEDDLKEMKNRASWHPFGHRADSVNDRNDGGEEVSSSVGCQLRYRRSDIFGYRLYRASEVVRSSVDSLRSGLSMDINEELINRFESQPPYPAYARSPSCPRMTDDLGCSEEFEDFGLDGSILSKATRRRDKPATGRTSRSLGPSPSPVPSQGDPDALSRVMTHQTTAERRRRRLEEKQLRREQRDKNREEKTKSKGKEKETRHRNDDQRAEKAHGKGNGKETESKKESSWSKKTASGFVVRQINDVKLKHPKPRRPGQVKKIVNMYKEKASSGIRLGKGSGVSSTRGAGGASDAGN
ncbi:hypothetical protein GGR54DRAFT_653857 [Hypoxylon sp. NC1633]|nr:hypothetical protein GGR54DRAFT_653857 [Hypoxylon sp. NC1633]